jgi:hypothetical protein
MNASVAYCISSIQSFVYQLLRDLQAASLPQKLGYSEAANVRKLLKTLSGRQDSNPRDQLGNMSVDCK